MGDKKRSEKAHTDEIEELTDLSLEYLNPKLLLAMSGFRGESKACQSSSVTTLKETEGPTANEGWPVHTITKASGEGRTKNT